MADSVLSELQSAVMGLLYPSEQDHPITAFVWPKTEAGAGLMDAGTVRRPAQIADAVPVETQTMEAFFEPITTPQDWHGAEEKKRELQGQELAEIVKRNLTDVKVFRFGGTDKTVYLVGKTMDGDLAGVKTLVVET